MKGGLEMPDYELYHFGIKGMKWGVRRYQNKDGSLTPAGRKRRKEEPHEDYKKVHDSKKVSQMSDSELRARNNRLQMEAQYKQLTKKTNVGMKAVKTFIAVAGTIAALEGAHKTYSRVGNAALDKIGDFVVNSIDLSSNLR